MTGSVSISFGSTGMLARVVHCSLRYITAIAVSHTDHLTVLEWEAKVSPLLLFIRKGAIDADVGKVTEH